jgi:hypothetical protein
MITTTMIITITTTIITTTTITIIIIIFSNIQLDLSCGWCCLVFAFPLQNEVSIYSELAAGSEFVSRAGHLKQVILLYTWPTKDLPRRWGGMFTLFKDALSNLELASLIQSWLSEKSWLSSALLAPVAVNWTCYQVQGCSMTRDGGLDAARFLFLASMRLSDSCKYYTA